MTGLSIIINQEIFKLTHFWVFNRNGEKWGKHIIYLRSSNVLLLLRNCWDLISDYENIICEYCEAINLQCPRKEGWGEERGKESKHNVCICHFFLPSCELVISISACQTASRNYYWLCEFNSLLMNDKIMGLCSRVQETNSCLHVKNSSSTWVIAHIHTHTHTFLRPHFIAAQLQAKAADAAGMAFSSPNQTLFFEVFHWWPFFHSF